MAPRPRSARGARHKREGALLHFNGNLQLAGITAKASGEHDSAHPGLHRMDRDPCRPHMNMGPSLIH
eukprot:3642431-Pyramimonas_sp.AAC.1